MTSEPTGADHWDATRVARWLAQADAVDRQLAPVTEALLAAAALRPGERVLDVGCGHGPIARLAAARTGPSGAVTGVDVAAGMLEAARAEGPVPDGPPLEWVEADVVSWSPPAGRFDVVLSRFGVMFFDDPDAAFGNLRRAASGAGSEGGRLAVATWATRDRSELFGLPMAVAVEVLEAEGCELPDLAVDGGAFSLGRPAVVRDVLGAAGWADVEPVEHTAPMLVGGGLGPAEAARTTMGIGPARVLTSDRPEDQRDRVAAALADRLSDHVDADGHVVLTGSFLVTTARAG